MVTPMGIPSSRLKISAIPENPVIGKAALTAKLSIATATKNPPSVSIKNGVIFSLNVCFSIVIFLPKCFPVF